MNLTQKLKQAVNDPLATFKWFERFLALFCICIPLILYITDKCEGGGHYIGFRSSISNYAYMWHSYVFGMLLGIAAMLFIFNGVVYFKNEGKAQLSLDKSGKWYNIVLGFSLLGVLVLPHKEFGWVHYLFAGSFFVGNALVTGYFHTDNDQKLNVSLAILTVAALAFYFLDQFVLHSFPWFTLFWAEWVSLAVVGIHFFLESKK